MARPYRTVARLVTEPTEDNAAYDLVSGMVLSWLPGQGPFPLVLEHGKEYHIGQNGEGWVLRARIAAPQSGPDG